MKIFLVLLVLPAFLGPGCSGQADIAASGSYPAFSWDKVPVCFHLGKQTALFTQEEATFLASHSGLIFLEKGHAIQQLGTTEKGIEMQARLLKAVNPDVKVIFYWNTFLDYPLYDAHEVYEQHPEWWLRTTDGELDLKQGRLRRYDLSNKEVRSWWTGVAKDAVVGGTTDGVFMDAFPQILSKANITLWGQEKYDAVVQGLWEILDETRAAIGHQNLIFYNGIRSTTSGTIGPEYLSIADGAMIEHFGHFQSGSKESMQADIEAMIKAGEQGKIIVFKAWPGYTWLDESFMEKSYQEKVDISRENIGFPLACFLVGAQKYAYFCYTWGYREDHGAFAWYDEFDKPLGKPLSAAVRDGFSYSREFEYATVWVDLENRQSRITWK
jgi:hypothetical protein